MDRSDLENAARAAAAQVGVAPEVFMGLVHTESAWNPFAHSPVGAVGLTQIMPGTWASWLGMTVEQLWEPVHNLTGGARILADELKRFGSYELALMAYNAGSPAVRRAITKAGTENPEEVSKFLPAETRAYWRKVLTWAEHYAGKIDSMSASVENTATDVTETVKDNPAGSALLLLLIAGIAWKAIR